MTSKDHKIFYAIAIPVVLIVGIILFFDGYRTSEHILAGGEVNKGKQSMHEILNSYAPIISALSALVSAIIIISTGFVIWTTCFRKTRRERIDDLKFEIHFLLSEKGITGMSTDHRDEFLEELEPKFQKEKYKKLHRFAFKELENEGIVETVPPYDSHIAPMY